MFCVVSFMLKVGGQIWLLISSNVYNNIWSNLCVQSKTMKLRKKGVQKVFCFFKEVYINIYLWRLTRSIHIGTGKYFLVCNKKKQVWLCRRIKSRTCQIQTFELSNNQSTTLLTFTIWNVTFLKNELFMSYQRFKKWWSSRKKSVYGKKCAKIH